MIINVVHIDFKIFVLFWTTKKKTNQHQNKKLGRNGILHAALSRKNSIFGENFPNS